MASLNPEENFLLPIEMRTVDLLSHRTMGSEYPQLKKKETKTKFNKQSYKLDQH